MMQINSIMSKGVKQELIERYNQIQAEKRFCYNCRSDSTKDTHNRMIFWKAYTFCSAWCQYDTESAMYSGLEEEGIQVFNKRSGRENPKGSCRENDIRKSWKQFTRHI